LVMKKDPDEEEIDDLIEELFDHTQKFLDGTFKKKDQVNQEKIDIIPQIVKELPIEIAHEIIQQTEDLKNEELYYKAMDIDYPTFDQETYDKQYTQQWNNWDKIT
jgi:hypothetical protein